MPLTEEEGVTFVLELLLLAMSALLRKKGKEHQRYVASRLRSSFQTTTALFYSFLKRKERENEEAMYIEETQRLVTEVKNVKVVLYLVNRKKKKKKKLISTFYCTTT